MIEVPCLLFELDALMKKVDFVSVGSNDLMQFMFAADRTNARVGSRYDALSAAPLKALKSLVKAAQKHRVPLTLCGEMAARPIEAMALIALGFRSLSMAPASIGPVKAMILALHAGRAAKLLDELLKKGSHDIRDELDVFARAEGIEV
jgi:phosphotransferase system enzyme I (PtsP)